jgi:hypothetical protein
MLISVFVLCILFGLISITDPNNESFASLPFALSIPARGWGELDATSLENVVRPGGLWLWALLQWNAYYGHYLTLALWATFAAILLRYNLRRATVTAGDQSFTFRDHVAAFSPPFGMASLQLCALLLALHLALMPAIVAAVEQEVEQKLAFAPRPSDHWSEVMLAVQGVQSNQELMDELRTAAKAEMLHERSYEPGSEQLLSIWHLLPRL